MPIPDTCGESDKIRFLYTPVRHLGGEKKFIFPFCKVNKVATLSQLSEFLPGKILIDFSSRAVECIKCDTTLAAVLYVPQNIRIICVFVKSRQTKVKVKCVLLETIFCKYHDMLVSK